MAMQTFTGFEYLLIDAANNNHLDKEVYEKRIEWALANFDNLEEFIPTSEKPPLYAKAVQAIRKAQAGTPTGHLVGFDASCSGIQIMSAVTGCYTGALHTGLVDPDVRADAYTTATGFMNKHLSQDVEVSRADAKAALMTSFYGSKKRPKEIFGEDTPELNAFYLAAYETAPGAWDLLQALLASWKPFALEHSWKLPDGFDAVCRVMVKHEARIEVDELDHATFSYVYKTNEGTEDGLSNAANVVHSLDAFLLREVHRRCNYDSKTVRNALAAIEEVLELRELFSIKPETPNQCSKVAYYISLYEQSTMPSVVILPHLDTRTVHQLSTNHLEALQPILKGMLQYEPFEVVTIHDESI